MPEMVEVICKLSFLLLMNFNFIHMSLNRKYSIKLWLSFSSKIYSFAIYLSSWWVEFLQLKDNLKNLIWHMSSCKKADKTDHHYNLHWFHQIFTNNYWIGNIFSVSYASQNSSTCDMFLLYSENNSIFLNKLKRACEVAGACSITEPYQPQSLSC